MNPIVKDFKRKLFIVSLLATFSSIIGISLVIFLVEDRITFCFVIIQLIGAITLIVLAEYMKNNVDLIDHYIKTEKMRLIGEMTAIVSHEINNPLTEVNGFLQLLNLNALSINEREKYLRLALNGLSEVKEKMNDYLLLANPYPDKMEKVNLTDELRDVVRGLKELATQSYVSIHIDCPHEVFMKCERKKIRMVLTNIVRNSIQAMEKGGILLVEIIEEEDQILINFQDTGVGMTNEQVSKLGEPSFSLEKEGTGIGLTFVYRIIQLYNGKIEISSEINEGTTINITFPKV